MILRKKKEQIPRNLIREKFLIMYKLNAKGGYRMCLILKSELLVGSVRRAFQGAGPRKWRQMELPAASGITGEYIL